MLEFIGSVDRGLRRYVEGRGDEVKVKLGIGYKSVVRSGGI